MKSLHVSALLGIMGGLIRPSVILNSNRLNQINGFIHPGQMRHNRVAPFGPLHLRNAKPALSHHRLSMVLQQSLDKYNYHWDGFVCHPAVIPPQKIAIIVNELLAIVDGDIERIRNNNNLVDISPEVRHLAKDKTLLKLVAQAAYSKMGSQIDKEGASPEDLIENIVLMRSTLMDKPKDRGRWRVLWHQDRVTVPRNLYHDEQRGIPGRQSQHSAVIMRIHLDPSKLENGCLTVLPRSHLHGVLDKKGIQKKVQQYGHLAVDCVMGVGDVLLFDPLLIHASEPNRSGEPRKVIQLEYHIPNC